MLYPTISNMISVRSYSGVIDNYVTKVSKYDKAYNSLLYRQAFAYNKSLTSTSMADAFTYPSKEESEAYSKLLNVDNTGVMGYISIPKINVRIPIYHGTSEKTLEKGVGHLEGSSLPIGGIGNHVILSAHRGLPSSKLFSDLDQMRVGDQFYIYVLNKTLAYQIDSVKVIKPSELDSFVKEEDKDYVTLVTCTPYGVNTHRLLVRGSRVEYKKAETNKIEGSRKLSVADIVLYASILLVIIVIIVSIIVISKSNKKKKLLEANNNYTDNPNLQEKNLDNNQSEYHNNNDIPLI